MNRYIPVVILVVFGQAIIAYLLVDQVVLRRLYGLPTEEIRETRADILIGDEPEAIYRGLGEFLLTPSDAADTRGLRHLRATISLGVSPAKAAEQLQSQNPRLRDAIIRILTAKAVEKLDDPEDREFIKDEIRFTLNRLLKQGEILEVYFTDFIVQ